MKPSEHAKYWPTKNLGEVAEFLDHIRRPINEAARQERIAGKKPEDLFPYYGANGQVGWIDDYLFDEDLVLLAEDAGPFGSTTEPIAYPVSGKTWVNNHAHVLRALPGIITHDYLYYSLVIRPDILPLVSGTTRSKLNQTMAKQIPIPLPPLPVQERIVAILQKADEIRRKRQEALKLADDILIALFHTTLGDPEGDTAGYDVRPLAQLVRDRRGVKCGPFGSQLHISELTDSGIPVLGIDNVASNRFIDTRDKFVTPDKAAQLASCRVSPGDVIITRTGTAGRAAVVPENFRGAVIGPNLLKVSPAPERLLPEVLSVAINFSPAVIHQIRRLSPGSTVAVFNVPNLKRIRLTIPPIAVQRSFLRQYAAIEQLRDSLEHALQEAETTFQVVLQRAFTGELTAEWEARNADWITQRQAFYERLPQLVLLAFLHEKTQHAGRAAEATVLITALMKYAFLLQMEGASRRRLYSFLPYHYGPFAQEVYSDLESLQDQSLVAVKEDNDKTRISLADAGRAEQALQELPEDLRQDVATIAAAYGDLDHEALLNVVYDKYPAYTKKSRRRR